MREILGIFSNRDLSSVPHFPASGLFSAYMTATGLLAVTNAPRSLTLAKIWILSGLHHFGTGRNPEKDSIRMDALHTYLVKKTGIPAPAVSSILALLEDGATIPFMARYRKDQTGGVAEDQALSLTSGGAPFLRESVDDLTCAWKETMNW